MAGASLGTAYVQVVASAQGIKGSITNALSGEASTAGTKAGSMIGGKLKGALLAAGIGTALVGVFKSAIAETGKLQQSYLGGLDTLYGEAADKAREYARAAQEAGISQSNYAEQAVSFGAALKQAYGGDTTKALEAANKAILDMADNAAKMGTPLESVQQAYQGFAKGQFMLLDNLKLGYGGTKTEMERLLADAEKITGVKYDINNLGDIYEAIHVIQGELGLTGVAADEAKNTLTGSFEGMKAAWDNLMGNIGLGENVGSSMSAFTDAVSNYLFNNLIPTIGNIIVNLPTAIASFIGQGLPQLVSAGIDMVNSLATGMAEQFPVMIKQLLDGLTEWTASLGTNSNAMMSAGANLINSVLNGIMTALPLLIQAAPKILGNILIGLAQNLPKMIASGFTIINSLLKGLISAVPMLIGSLPKIINGIKNAFMKVPWGKLGIQVIRMIARGLLNTIGTIKTAIGKAKDAILNPIKKVVEKVKGFFPLSIGKIFSNLKIPKIHIKGGKAPFGIGGFGTAPKISVTWNKKAMENPYLFSNATLFGAGETGDEVLYGKSALMSDIADATGGGIDYERIGVEVAKALSVAGIETIVELDGKTIAKGTAKAMRQELNNLDVRANRAVGIVGV